MSGVIAIAHLQAIPHKYSQDRIELTHLPIYTVLKRALTTSFGDICYESIAIPPLNLFYNMIEETSIFEIWMQRFNTVNIMV